MRVLSRVALVLSLVVFSLPLFAQRLTGDCPVSLVGNTPADPIDDFSQSPHGVFRSGNQVYVLRGQNLFTYTVTDLGDLVLAREDFLGSLFGRESVGGVAFANNILYVSSEAGIEVFSLNNVRPGGSDPRFLARLPNVRYRRLAVSGTTLAALFPATDLPCYTSGTTNCFNTIDLYNVSDTTRPPVRVSTIMSTQFLGFNDIAFNQGFLFAASESGVVAFNVNNPSSPAAFTFPGQRSTFLISNGTNLLAAGNEKQITVFTVSTNAVLSTFATLNRANETINRSNPVIFHPQGFFDDQNGRVVTMLDELDPQTLKPARTFAFDIFDLTTPMFEGAFQRGYETISFLTPDEVKHNPVTVGPNIYVIGEVSGLQTYGACGQVTGRIEFDTLNSLNCGGAELHGWVTGAQKIANVEIFLDNASLGRANIGGPVRTDISSRTPVQTWRISVNFDNIARGERTLRAVGEDVFGNRRQFAIQKVFFNGPGLNCSNRRRSTGR